MFQRLIQVLVVVCISGFAKFAFADGHATTSWTLDGASSKIAFGSIKKDTVGEVHSFQNVTGHVLPDGSTTVEIALGSVETNIDIRNERMVAHLFKNAPTATLSAQIDMDALTSMSVGGTAVVDVEGVLSFVGAELDIELEMFVARLSETSVLITSNGMLFVGAEDIGIDAGITKLMELADLPGITRTTPVTLRFVFKADQQKAEAAPGAPVTQASLEIAGDAVAGKKVFRKCKACHSVKTGKTGAGPTLHAIMGRAAGTVEGFKYSEAMKSSGVVWTAKTMSAFLTKPKDYLTGTSMAFAGLKREEDITSVIAYLLEATLD